MLVGALRQLLPLYKRKSRSCLAVAESRRSFNEGRLAKADSADGFLKPQKEKPLTDCSIRGPLLAVAFAMAECN
jgi:hypothetical protein